jgi:hypothetical protein
MNFAIYYLSLSDRFYRMLRHHLARLQQCRCAADHVDFASTTKNEHGFRSIIPAVQNIQAVYCPKSNPQKF